MTKIYYSSRFEFEDINITIDHYIKPDTEAKSKWWEGLPLFDHGASSIGDWFERAIAYNKRSGRRIFAPVTVKSCPAIGDLLSQSYVFQAPVDFAVNIEPLPDGSGDVIEYITPTNCTEGGNDHDPLLKIESHGAAQLKSSSGNIYKDKVNIKIVTPIAMKSNKPIQYLFLPPVYHADSVEYEVMPGILGLNPKFGIGFNLNLMFPRKPATYTFKAGQPLAYMTFLNCNKPKFEQVPHEQPFRKKFFGDYRMKLKQ